MGPCGGLFLLVAGGLLSCVVDGSGLCYFFMGACGVYYMTLWTWEAMCRREVLLSGWYFTSVHCLRGRGRHDGTVGCRGGHGAFGVRSSWPAKAPATDPTAFLIRWEPFRQPVTKLDGLISPCSV